MGDTDTGEGSDTLSMNNGADNDSNRSQQLPTPTLDHEIGNTADDTDSIRTQRLHERSSKKEIQLLTTQLFLSLCDQINNCTDKNHAFLSSYEQSINAETHDVIQADVENFIVVIDDSVNDITNVYNELSQMNKDKSDKTHETVYFDFLNGIKEFKTRLTANQETEQKLLEEEQRLETAKRELEEKLKQFREKNQTLRTRLASHITVRPITSPRTDSTDESGERTLSPTSSATSSQQDFNPASAHSPARSANSTEQNHNPNKDWIKDFTREITAGMAEQLVHKERRRPKKAIEPDIFSGNAMEFNDWEIDWEAYVEAQELTEKEALRFIKKFLSGKAKDCVIGLLSVNTAEAYRQVRRKLQERFSTEQDIAGIFKKRLRQWPALREPDGEKLQEFADFLDHIKSSRTSVKGLYSLDEKEQNESMCQKLPHDIKLKWVEILNQRRMAKQEYPSFSDFVDFVQTQAFTYTNPIMRRQATKFNLKSQSDNNGKSGQRPTPPIRSYHTAYVDSQGPKKPYCHFCQNNNHPISECGEFAKKSYEERMKFVSSNRLCFRCAKHRGLAKDCKGKMVCEICGKNHVTVLHNPQHITGNASNGGQTGQLLPKANPPDVKQQNPPRDTATESSASPLANNNPKKVMRTKVERATYSMVVPVYVSAGGIEKLVYALLDTASDSCYIDGKVAAEIKAHGVEKEVTMLTMNAETKECLNMYKNLNIRGYLTNASTSMDAFQSNDIRCNPTEIPTPERCAKIPHLQKISHHLTPLLDIPVGLLIGGDCPQAICPKASIEGPSGDPFAVKTMFGWTLCGGKPQPSTIISCRTTMRPMEPRPELFQLVEQDFKDVEGKPISQQELKFLEILDRETIQEENGTYVMPLPFKSRPQLPNNRRQAVQRLLQLKTKLLRDPNYKTEYQQFMNNLLQHDHAEEVLESEVETSECWYIPHFGVRHPKKNKLRVVYDGSCNYNSMSLNDWLLKGPDQMNDLLGILLRFRLGEIAITCDVEQMFYNFKVATSDRNFLRFLWFDTDMQTIKTYRMTRHIFGATSSPGVATYGLRKIASEYSDISPTASTFLTRDVYVDDGISSVDTVEEAKALVRDARAICAKGNLRLHKFLSNNSNVLEDISAKERATTSTANEDIVNLPLHRTLGVEWCTSKDVITFTSNLQPKPITRRGILSTIAQVYDPIGLVAPFTLNGKNILQDTCRQKLDWDDEVGEELKEKWQQWLADLKDISKVQVSRHIKPHDFGKVKAAELHHFSDASTEGYGACSYLRMISSANQVHVALVLSKARVAPLKQLTIPRMELQGAVTATRLSEKLKSELSIDIQQEYFWCDSMIVLGYVKNETTKFLPYVSNRVSEIRSKSKPQDWYHVPGPLNPADMPSRGTSIKHLMDSSWFSGPMFLWEHEITPILKDQPAKYEIDVHDKEIKKLKVNNTVLTTNESQPVKIKNFSKLRSLINAVARLQNAAKRIKNKEKPYFRTEAPDLSAYKNAEELVVRQCQAEHHGREIQRLKNGKQLIETSKLNQLTPLLDESGIMRVGTRATNSSVLTEEEKRPKIIPSQSWLARLYIDFHHTKVQHQGRLFTQSSMRQDGIWIPGAQRMIKSYIRQCVTCKYLRGKAATQKMGNLPNERIEPTPPFTHVGVDTFGPFLVKERRSEIKRWCLVFTCMYSRAVHIEVINDLSTDSFLQALRCLQSIRGPVLTIFSDAGTNFMGAKPILTNVTFKTNTPGASHQGGVWERIIRQIRAIFSKMVGKYASRLDSAALRTVMYEVMYTINSKPLTTKSLDDPTEGIVTPNHLLTMKGSQLQPTPGEYTEKEIYGIKMYNKVEQFAEEFNTRWRDYLSTIETRQKWKNTAKNITVGDVVSVVDDNSHRNAWKTGIVEAVKIANDGLVRAASVRVSGVINSKGQRQSSTILERPIQKLIVIMKQ